MKRVKTTALALLCLCAMHGVAPARADAFTCTVSGAAGTFQIKKLVVPYLTGQGFDMTMKWDWAVFSTSGTHYHFFAGFYLVRARDFQLHAYSFADYSQAMAPPSASFTLQGDEVGTWQLPSSGELSDGKQGAYAYGNSIYGDTYYLIGFADGSGSYSVTMSTGADAGCTDVDAPGQIVSLNADSFKGGTQVRGPGYGVAQSASVSFVASYRRVAGAMYAYEPNPFGPATVRLDTERGANVYTNKIVPLVGPDAAQSWNLTADYQGRTDTILLEVLQFDL